MKPGTNSGNGAGDCKWKSPKCEEEQAEGSVYCKTHRDKKRALNQAYLEKRRQSKSPAARPRRRPRSRGKPFEAELSEAIVKAGGGLPPSKPAPHSPSLTAPPHPEASADMATAIRCLDETIEAGTARLEKLKAARDIMKKLQTQPGGPS